MGREQQAGVALKALLEKPATEVVLGISALQMVKLLAHHFTSCPECGTEPWCDVDCRVCDVMRALENEP